MWPTIKINGPVHYTAQSPMAYGQTAIRQNTVLLNVLNPASLYRVGKNSYWIMYCRPTTLFNTTQSLPRCSQCPAVRYSSRNPWARRRWSCPPPPTGSWGCPTCIARREDPCPGRPRRSTRGRYSRPCLDWLTSDEVFSLFFLNGVTLLSRPFGSVERWKSLGGWKREWANGAKFEMAEACEKSARL